MLQQPASSQHPAPGSGPYQNQPCAPRGRPDHRPHSLGYPNNHYGEGLDAPILTGRGLDRLPPPPLPHSAPHCLPLALPHQDDRGQHVGYDGLPPPGGYRNNLPRPPPLPPMQPHDPHAYHLSPGPEPTQSKTSYSDSSKKKATRASQACEYCRHLKAKCDETKPCKTCKGKGIECLFRESVPKPSDKTNADILDGINRIEKKMELAHKRLSDLEREWGHAKMENDADTPARPGSPRSTAPSLLTDPYSDPNNEQPLASDEEQLEARTEEDYFTQPPESNARPGPPVISHHHTTSAGRLLAWPSTEKLIQQVLPRVTLPYDFPLGIREWRVILRQERSGRGKCSATDNGHLEVDTKTYSEPGSFPAGDWAQPDYSPGRLYGYFESFQANILSLHPIVCKRYFTECVERFLQQTAAQNVSTNAAIGKRKRPPPGSAVDRPVHSGARPGLPSCSVETAIILAALALGKLTRDKCKIPDMTMRERKSYNSPVIHNGHLVSPAQAFPTAHLQPSDVVPPRNSSTGSASRRPSWQGSGPSVPSKPVVPENRSYESMPGLEYLGPATDIVGNDSGVTIQHVQANILIALYYGQIGDVVQSLEYIRNASYTLHVYMRSHLPRLERQNLLKMKGLPLTERSPEDHPMILAFWTCWQLESDIVVELNIAPSWISSYEERIPYPDFAEGEIHIGASYLAHLFIRKKLNFANRTFHSDDPGPADANGDVARKVTVKEVQDMTRGCHWLSSEYQFHEDDQPASEILSARLRAKYWDYQVICVLPFVKMILDFSCQLKDGLSTDEIIPEHHYFNRTKVEAPLIKAGTQNYDGIDPEIVGFAEEGIRALIESTRAFHNIDGERLILTNLFGIAIAHWGNLMVLSACYKDPFLCDFVDQATLRSLLDRTVTWISMAAQSSSSLAFATRMLEELRDNIFTPPEATSAIQG